MEIYQQLPKSAKDKINIFVDDISDTGDTFKTLFPERNSYTATLHIKPHTGYVPTFYQDKINNNIWVVSQSRSAPVSRLKLVISKHQPNLTQTRQAHPFAKNYVSSY